MKIAILGAGMIGSTLGALWAKAGHDVIIAARTPTRREHVAAAIGARARAASVEDAVRDGEVVLLAIPFGAVEALGQEHGGPLVGKVVLDACNPFINRDGAAAHEALDGGHGSGTYTAQKLPGARVVKAFNTVYFKTMENEAHREGDRVAIPLAADDEDALAVAETLVTDAGFEPVRVGALVDARRFDPGTTVFNTGMSARKVRSALKL